MRLQLALNVRDLEEAVAYYSKLFGAAPHKRRTGYANFTLDRPPLKLVLFENAAAERLNHLGVEVFEPAEVEEAARRLADAGIMDETRQDVTCCHATQDKVWTQEPQGLRWEWYRITDDDPVRTEERPASGCCGTPVADAGACCT